jgi:hypothetical protein
LQSVDSSGAPAEVWNDLREGRLSDARNADIMELAKRFCAAVPQYERHLRYI